MKTLQKTLKTSQLINVFLTVRRKGKTFFGVDFGKYCRCGNTWPDFTLLRERSECKVECMGEPGSAGKCGGSFVANIYVVD